MRSMNASRLAYQSYGNGDETLVFLHAYICDSLQWAPQIESLSQSSDVSP